MNASTLRLARQDLRALKYWQSAKKFKDTVKLGGAAKAAGFGMGPVVGAGLAGAYAIGNAYGDFSMDNTRYTNDMMARADALVQRIKSMRRK